MQPPREPSRIRDRVLPLVYFAAGHLLFVGAALVVATEPESLSGFFLHPRMAAVVHAVTLGWLTTSIFGALYLVWPVALGHALRVRAIDIAGCVLLLAAITGVLAHFWIDTYVNVGLAGVLALVAGSMLVFRFLGALRTARGPAAVRAHVALALINLLLVMLLGTLAAIHKRHPFLGASPVDLAIGHLHLGLLGWVILMVVGIGYRLLPMFLPAHPPQGRRVWATAVLIEIGALGLAVSHAWAKPFAPAFAVVAASGVLLFLFNMASMLRNRVPPPKKMPLPDIGMLHALQALLYLLACIPIGLALVFSDDWNFDLVMVYGVCGLIGFPAQLVVGVAMRLFPMFSWREAWLGSGFRSLPANPHAMPVRMLQWATLILWTLGVPSLILGLGRNQTAWISAAGWLLAAGALFAGANSLLVLRHAFGSRPPAPSTGAPSNG